MKDGQVAKRHPVSEETQPMSEKLPPADRMQVLVTSLAVAGMSLSVPPSAEPLVELMDWRVMRIREPGRCHDHLVGRRGSRGRVSSAVQSIDFLSLTGLTQSGRQYVLHGPPGHDDDATYVWESLLRMTNRTASVTDLTRAVLRRHQRMASRVGQSASPNQIF